MTFAHSFWSKVDPAPSECCWEWTGCIESNHYGRVWFNNRNALAHRVAYQLAKGEIPDGLMVRHTCDNPACCNPNHLILGTHTENMADRRERNRQAKGEKHYASKLTATQAMEVYNSSLKQYEIAKLYNIDRTIVSKIKLKKIWKHIHS
jgi:hypothetical protein